MTDFPVKLLMAGFLLSGIGACTLWFGGAGIVFSFLVFWIGGAVCVLGLAVTPGLGRAFVTRSEDEDASKNLVTEAELWHWDSDRILDSLRDRVSAGRSHTQPAKASGSLRRTG
ncbi:MAG: hypothetical protein AAGL24_02850 [Pseudomonadota bacterium]